MKQLSLTLAVLCLIGAALTQKLDKKNGETADKVYNRLSKKGLEEPTDDLNALKTAYENFGPITLADGILSFASPEHVHATQMFLEAAHEAHAFKLWQNNGFNLPSSGEDIQFYQTYKKFEDDLGFVSLRQSLESNFIDWLNSGSKPDLNDDPYKNQYPETGLQALLNTDSEIKVGDKYFRVSVEGSKIFDDLQALRSSPTSSSGRRLETSDTPVTKCNDPIFKSKLTFHPTSNHVLYTSLQHYCKPETPTTCTYKVRATSRVFSSGVTDQLDIWPGPVYAHAYGLVSGKYVDPSTKEDLPNMCYVATLYNYAGANAKFWIHSAVNSVEVGARTKTGWTFGKFFGNYETDTDLISLWPMIA